MKTLTVILELINYSCKQKPINDNHLGQVDESQYLMKQPKKHHVFIWDETWFSSEIKHLHFNETFYWLTQLIHKQYYMKTMFMLSCSLLLSVPRWQLHGGAKVQVTGHRSGYRSGHRSDHRSHTQTIGHWTKLFLIDIYYTKIKQAKVPQLYFFCSELYQISHIRTYIHVDHARRTCVTA